MDPDTTIARLARADLGVVTRSQALDEGLTAEEVDHQLERQLLGRLHRGVYLHGAVALTREGRCLAAVKAAGEGAVISHRSAARLWGLDRVPVARIELTVPHTDLPLRAGLLVHRTNFLPPADRTVLGRVPVTSVARTLLDLGAVVPFEVVEQAVSDAVTRTLVTPPQLYAVLDRTGKRGRRGTAALRAVMRDADPDEKSESELERRLWRLAPKPPGLVQQHEVVLSDGKRCRLDMALPERMIAIEADGHRWHADAKRTRADRERRRALEKLGWHVYEYGWSDVVDDAEATRAELRAILLPLAA
jgi:very-short-patch-repair endonuclease